MAITQQQLIDILKTGTYARNLQVRAGDRAYHLYPSIEVTVPKPQSPTGEIPGTITSEYTFQVRIYQRFTRTQELDSNELATFEAEVLNVLDDQPLQDTEFFFQSEIWSRKDTKDVHGLESSLSIGIREIIPSVPGTMIGAGSTLQLDNILLSLIGSHTGDEGRQFHDTIEDTGDRFPIKGRAVGSRFFEYRWNQVKWNNVNELIERGELITGTLSNSDGEIRSFECLPVVQRDQVSYANTRTVIVQIEILKDVVPITPERFVGVDAILVNT